MHRSLRIGLFALALVATVPLASCAGVGQALQNVGNYVAGKPTAATATTVAGAEGAFTVAANLETVWLQSGKATKAQAVTAKNLRTALYANIVTAREAVANGDSPGVAVALKLFNEGLPEFSNYITSGGNP